MAESTKQRLAEAMKRLLLMKPLDKIYATEICRGAGIERPTFRYYFKDKYDLMAWIFFRAPFEGDITDTDQMTAAMNQMRSDFIFYKRTYEEPSQNPFWEYVLEFFVERYTDIAKKKLGTDLLDQELICCIRLYCHGLIGMMREWLLKDDITSARMFVKMMVAVMPKQLKEVVL